MIKTRGEWTPEINYNTLQRAILITLARKSFSLTGNEIKFIRKFFKKTLEAFGQEFGVSHVAVLDWESKKNKPIKSNPATEKCIRLFIFDSLIKTNSKFRECYHEIEIKKLAEQQKTKSKKIQFPIPLVFDAQELLIA